MIWPILKMVLVLAVLGAGLFCLSRWSKRNGAGRTPFSSDSGIRLLSTQLIAPQKYISLVQIGDEVLALGVSESQITLLTKVENKEFIGKVAARVSVRPEAFPLFHYVQGFFLKPKGSKRGFLRRIYGR